MTVRESLGGATPAARFTSRDILRAERTNLAAAWDGYGRDLAVVDPRVADLAISAFYAACGFTPSEEQAEVLERLVSAGHGVDAVVGVAGAGKTTLMAAARTAWQAAGYTVAGAATAAVAAQNLQAESGKALWHAPPPAGLRYDAWFLDEGRCYALAVNRRDTTFQLVITDLHTGTNLRELWWRPNIR